LNRLKMKTTATLLIAIFMISAFAVSVMAQKDDGVTTIRDGTLVDAWGHPLVLGFDEYGYNYQAHIFVGWYHNAGRKTEVPWTEETLIAAGKTTTWLVMKWNDVWLSNVDRDEDGLLDRGYTKGSEEPYTSSGVPGAWETNHQWGSYEEFEQEYMWTYFVKIVAAPDDADIVTVDGVDYYYLADGTEMGTVIWTEYARVLRIYNDQGTGEHGVDYNPAGPTGFGCYQ